MIMSEPVYLLYNVQWPLHISFNDGATKSCLLLVQWGLMLTFEDTCVTFVVLIDLEMMSITGIKHCYK